MPVAGWFQFGGFAFQYAVGKGSNLLASQQRFRKVSKRNFLSVIAGKGQFNHLSAALILSAAAGIEPLRLQLL